MIHSALVAFQMNLDSGVFHSLVLTREKEHCRVLLQKRQISTLLFASSEYRTRGEIVCVEMLRTELNKNFIHKSGPTFRNFKASSWIYQE